MKRHANISIFVPHLGCPVRCSFCDQTRIARTVKQPSAEDVDRAVETAMSGKNYDPANTEIAFFGGSFTAVDREYMTALLEAAARHVEAGRAVGIRASTRPDAVDAETVALLKKYHVTALELGAQSMSDRVLALNHRGHDSESVVQASRLVREGGISLGLQMMTGLLGDTDEGAIYTARRLVDIKPDTVRIYPTIVRKGTALEREFLAGSYRPQTLEEAAALAAKLLVIFEEAGVQVIRLGLHEIDPESYVAGPWHPAFREIAEGGMYLEILKSRLDSIGAYDVYCAPDQLSRVIGQGRRNVAELAAAGRIVRVSPDPSLTGRRLIIEKKTDKGDIGRCF